jgi:DNA-binding transcriptional MerR regulator/DNA-directed RNA polymerase subunit RPC12/RpoP
MSKYTTGEIAKLCGVSVRTVQYYDTRGILTPSELSEGGRRLYSETDLQRMKIICFLRELDLPLNSIGELLSEEHPESVISLLLEQQEKTLREEIAQRQARLDKLTDLRRALKELEHFSVESIGDIALKMENKKKLRKLYTVLFATGIPVGIVEWTTIIFWIVTGNWRPFVFYLVVAVPYVVVISRYFFKRVAYICPECHAVFKPTLKEAFFARHTPTLRKVTCTHCGHKGFCVETYGGKADRAQT